MDYCNHTKVENLVCRGKFDVDLGNTGYIFDIDATFELLDDKPLLVGVFGKPPSRYQQGILFIADKCESTQELRKQLEATQAGFSLCEDNHDLFILYSSKKITFAFCKYGYSFLFAFPRMLINYNDKEHVEYVSRIEEENQNFVNYMVKTLSLAEKVEMDFEDKALLQEFCENYVFSYPGKNALDDYCFANCMSTISKKILINLRQEINNINGLANFIGEEFIDEKRIQTIRLLLDRYLK